MGRLIKEVEKIFKQTIESASLQTAFNSRPISMGGGVKHDLAVMHRLTLRKIEKDRDDVHNAIMQKAVKLVSEHGRQEIQVKVIAILSAVRKTAIAEMLLLLPSRESSIQEYVEGRLEKVISEAEDYLAEIAESLGSTAPKDDSVIKSQIEKFVILSVAEVQAMERDASSEIKLTDDDVYCAAKVGPDLVFNFDQRVK